MLRAIRFRVWVFTGVGSGLHFGVQSLAVQGPLMDTYSYAHLLLKFDSQWITGPPITEV